MLSKARMCAGLVLASVWSAALAIPVVDVDTLDLANTAAGPAVFAAQHFAQVYAVGTGGVLSAVELPLYATVGTTGSLTVVILPTLAGLPDAVDAHALYATEIPMNRLPVGPSSSSAPAVRIDVSSARIVVTPGQVLALGVIRNAGFGAPPWVIWKFGMYPGSGAFARASSGSPWMPMVIGADARFGLGLRTIVDVVATGQVVDPTGVSTSTPAGIAVLLIVVAMSGLFVLGRRKRMS
jgi:hypothetical protein